MISLESIKGFFPEELRAELVTRFPAFIESL